MNSASFISSVEAETNSTLPISESWFIPLDILMIIPMALAVILTVILLVFLSIDKTCHTIPMLFIANRLFTAVILGSTLLGTSIFTLVNDLQQIQYQDSLCVFRGYMIYAAGAAQNYSNGVEAVYRYLIVVYPTRLFFRSIRFPTLVICLSWIFSFIYPLAFIFTGAIVYNVDNQICQLPLRSFFSTLCMSFCTYGMPILFILFNYFKLFRLSAFLITSIIATQRITLPDADRSYLIELLPQTHKDISTDRAHALVFELENFYTGVRDNLWTDCGPPYEIDKAFHLHIINTRMYEAFSQATFGRFVHHSPFWSAHPAPNDLLERCGDQVKKLRDHGVPIAHEHLWMPPTRGKCENNLVDEEVEHNYYCEL